MEIIVRKYNATKRYYVTFIACHFDLYSKFIARKIFVSIYLNSRDSLVYSFAIEAIERKAIISYCTNLIFIDQ